jgi:hypothetical protein
MAAEWQANQKAAFAAVRFGYSSKEPMAQQDGRNLPVVRESADAAASLAGASRAGSPDILIQTYQNR